MVYERKVEKLPYDCGATGLTPFEIKSKTKGKVEVETISLGILMPGDTVTFKGDKEVIESLLFYP